MTVIGLTEEQIIESTLREGEQVRLGGPPGGNVCVDRASTVCQCLLRHRDQD